MAISLYEATVPGWRQIVGGVSHFMDKAATHFIANGVDLADVAQTRLFPDMFPFTFQILMVHVHSIGAIEAVKKGEFAPPRGRTPPSDYAACQQLVADTRAALDALPQADVEALQGRDMYLQLGENRLPFTAEGFLLSFSMPNFHFHAATAYDILRMKGAPLGKRDYITQLQLKT
jgi:hypothetical protein